MLVRIIFEDGSSTALPPSTAVRGAGDIIAIGGREHRIVWARHTIAAGELLEFFTVPMPVFTTGDAPEANDAPQTVQGAVDNAMRLFARAGGEMPAESNGLVERGFTHATVVRSGAAYFLDYQTIPERISLDATTRDAALAEAAEFLGDIPVDLISYRDA